MLRITVLQSASYHFVQLVVLERPVVCNTHVVTCRSTKVLLGQVFVFIAIVLALSSSMKAWFWSLSSFLWVQFLSTSQHTSVKRWPHEVLLTRQGRYAIKGRRSSPCCSDLVNISLLTILLTILGRQLPQHADPMSTELWYDVHLMFTACIKRRLQLRLRFDCSSTALRPHCDCLLFCALEILLLTYVLTRGPASRPRCYAEA